MNEVLRRAMFDARLSEVDVASRLAVEPKTVRNWLRGQLPHSDKRLDLCQLLAVDETVVWPALLALRAENHPVELAAVYARRMAITQDNWLSLFASAHEEIDILAYSALFLAEDATLTRLLADKGHQGVHIRIALGDPAGETVGRRAEEIAEATEVKIHNAIGLFRPLLKSDSVELRLHDTVLYNSMYRSDGQLLVNQHAFGVPAAQSPVYHLRRGGGGQMFESYQTSFERIWSTGAPAPPAIVSTV